MLIIFTFLLALYVESVRRQRIEVLALEYRYRFFALRDELREYAMENPETARNWVFQYLDSTIAKTIGTLSALSLWYVIGLWLTHKEDSRMDRARRALEREYTKTKNQKLKEIEEKCIDTLSEFMVSRHRPLFVCSILVMILPGAITAGLQGLRRRSLELVVESPETSTLESFAPAAG